MTTGDQTIFTDDDGTSYLICSSQQRPQQPLRGADPRLRLAEHRRRPRASSAAPGARGTRCSSTTARYYFCSSDLHGWNASHSYYIAATNIMGPYGAEGVIGNTDNDFSHVSQTGLLHHRQRDGRDDGHLRGRSLERLRRQRARLQPVVPAVVHRDDADDAVGHRVVAERGGRHLERRARQQLRAQPQLRGRPRGDDPAGRLDHQHTTTGGTTPYTNVSGGHTGNWSWQLTDTRRLPGDAEPGGDEPAQRNVHAVGLGQEHGRPDDRQPLRQGLRRQREGRVAHQGDDGLRRRCRSPASR